MGPVMMRLSVISRSARLEKWEGEVREGVDMSITQLLRAVREPDVMAEEAEGGRVM